MESPPLPWGPERSGDLWQEGGQPAGGYVLKGQAPGSEQGDAYLMYGSQAAGTAYAKTPRSEKLEETEMYPLHGVRK